MNPQLVQAAVLSLIPGVFWLWYVESHAPTRSSPWRLAVGCLGGGLSVFLVVFLSEALSLAIPSLTSLDDSVPGTLVKFVFVVGLVEELSKLLVVRVLLYPRRDFQEPWDGLSGSTSAALGFATAENIKYVLNFGSQVMLTRSVMSTFGHVLMSGIWGFALGLGKQRGSRRFGTFEALGWAAVGHGLYDFFLMIDQRLAALGVLLALSLIFHVRLRETVVESKRHLDLVMPVRECGHCRSLNRAWWSFCTHCGERVPEGGKCYCSGCMATIEGNPGLCPQCQRELFLAGT